MQNLDACGDSNPLASIIKTEDLYKRPSRSPDYEAESRALALLAGSLAEPPQVIFQRLAEAALNLCRAELAGISILEPGENNGVLRWHAAAATPLQNLQGTMPRATSPCGTALDRNTVLLLEQPWRHFSHLVTANPPIIE
ncbi:MAG TPA: hypothetical protein VEQ63_00055, partial [Bryobacteraceae bacterium]|nr:hypothetical protein [Bryobacteraceae bacterium]